MEQETLRMLAEYMQSSLNFPSDPDRPATITCPYHSDGICELGPGDCTYQSNVMTRLGSKPVPVCGYKSDWWL